MLTRIVLAGLAATHLWWGSWAYAAPEDFFTRFPGFGHRWTAAYPPFNEHLVFHSRHAGLLGGAEWGLSLITLVLGVLIPGALLALTWTGRSLTRS